jgi:flagellar M-ring protein FliF
MAVAADGTLNNDGSNTASEGTASGDSSASRGQQGTGIAGYAQSPQGRRVLLMIAAAAVIALMIGV